MLGQCVQREAIVVNLFPSSHRVVLDRLVGAADSWVKHVVHILGGGRATAWKQGEARMNRVLLQLFLSQRVLG